MTRARNKHESTQVRIPTQGNRGVVGGHCCPAGVHLPPTRGPQLGWTQLPSGQPPTVMPVAMGVMPDPSEFMMKRSRLPAVSRLLAKTILVPSGENAGNTSDALPGWVSCLRLVPLTFITKIAAGTGELLWLVKTICAC